MYSSDLGVPIVETGLATYPDVTVVCGLLRRDPVSRNTVPNPRLVLEVPGDSSERCYRGRQLEQHKLSATIDTIATVSHRAQRAEVWTRSNAEWAHAEAPHGHIVQLAAVGRTLDVTRLHVAVEEVGSLTSAATAFPRPAILPREEPHPTMLSRLLVPALTLCAALLGAACGNQFRGFDAAREAAVDATDLAMRPEAPADIVPLGRTCTRSAQCDDGIDCTDDMCDTDNRCVNVPNSGRCDNGAYCDGPERCDTRRGCMRGDPITCNDGFVCTEDRCIEATHSCTHTPLDRDGDGDPDEHCTAFECGDAGVPEPDAGVTTVCWRGHDCADFDPRINSTSPEICGDMLDNNCNGFTDGAEPGGCQRAPYDQCASPLDVSAGGVFTIEVAAAQRDYVLRCAGGLAHDVVARLTLTSSQDVDITADAQFSSVAVGLQTTCGSTVPADTLECDFGYPARVRRHSVPAGTYFVLIGSSGSGAVDLTVRLSPPTLAATNDTCATATVIPDTGGTWRSDLIGMANDVSTQCGGSARDVVYAFTLTNPMNVTLQAATGRTDNLFVTLASNCGPTVNTLRCDGGSTVLFTAHQLPVGTYFVFVESYDAVAFTFQASFASPTPPAQGDTCGNPLPLVDGVPVLVSSSTMENDYRLSCFTSGRDSVFQFTLTQRSDVLVDVVPAGTDSMAVAIASDCPGSAATTRSCTVASRPRVFALGLDPGTYYVVVKSYFSSDFTIALQALAPVAVTAAAGNDVCSSALAIPPSRAFFTGDTTALMHNYDSPCAGATPGRDAVFSLHLTQPQRVTLVTDSSFFHVAWISTTSSCPGAPPPGALRDCTLGTHTTLDNALSAGDYYVFIDGLSAVQMGTYSLLAYVTNP